MTDVRNFFINYYVYFMLAYYVFDFIVFLAIKNKQDLYSKWQKVSHVMSIVLIVATLIFISLVTLTRK
jgi:predicted membrane channel-forming protein YqfA (hemolysin III family)